MDRVVIAPQVHHGDPCIKGTRIPVSAIVGSIADGMSTDEVRAAYPQLSLQDIRAALAYAAEVVRSEAIAPIPGSPVPLRAKVDEDLPIQVAALLQQSGHRVDPITGEGMGGATDAALWAAVQAEGRFLATADRGFADIRAPRQELTAASCCSGGTKTGYRPCWS